MPCPIQVPITAVILSQENAQGSRWPRAQVDKAAHLLGVKSQEALPLPLQVCGFPGESSDSPWDPAQRGLRPMSMYISNSSDALRPPGHTGPPVCFMALLA